MQLWYGVISTVTTLLRHIVTSQWIIFPPLIRYDHLHKMLNLRSFIWVSIYVSTLDPFQLPVLSAMAPPTPILADYHLAQRVALYMCQRFCCEAFPLSDNPAPEPLFDLPVDTAVGMNHMVSMLVAAYNNRSECPHWTSAILSTHPSNSAVRYWYYQAGWSLGSNGTWIQPGPGSAACQELSLINYGACGQACYYPWWGWNYCSVVHSWCYCPINAGDIRAWLLCDLLICILRTTYFMPCLPSRIHWAAASWAAHGGQCCNTSIIRMANLWGVWNSRQPDTN